MFPIIEIPNDNKLCSCDLDLMSPKHMTHHKYSNVCLNCNSWITDGSYNAYNKYFGYSGYDEYPDKD